MANTLDLSTTQMDSTSLAEPRSKSKFLPPETQSYISIPDLRKAHPGLWYKLHVFIYDLRNFTTIDDSRKRLDSVSDPSYLGQPYFTPEEVHTLKHTILTEEAGTEPETKTLQAKIQATLDERLNRRMKRRVDSGDFRVCAAHDLAPVFERFFGVNSKKLGKDADFVSRVVSYGLSLDSDGSEWGEERGGNSMTGVNKKQKRKKR